jgi:hypothetical protein
MASIQDILEELTANQTVAPDQQFISSAEFAAFQEGQALQAQKSDSIVTGLDTVQEDIGSMSGMMRTGFADMNTMFRDQMTCLQTQSTEDRTLLMQERGRRELSDQLLLEARQQLVEVKKTGEEFKTMMLTHLVTGRNTQPAFYPTTPTRNITYTNELSPNNSTTHMSHNPYQPQQHPQFRPG